MPGEKWVTVQADTWGGPVTPASRIGGVSLLLRLCRQLARAGITHVSVRAGDGAGAVGDLLRRPPRGLTITTGTSQPEPPPALDARALYAQDTLNEWVRGIPHQTEETLETSPEEALKTPPEEAQKTPPEEALRAPPEPLVVLREPGDIKKAERMLWASVKKSVEHDGVVAYYMGRPLGRLISRVLVHTPITPNQVTLLSLLASVCGAALAAVGGYWWFLTGTALYLFGMVLDCVDGDLARVRVEGSVLGQWLDSVVDDISTCAITVGMGVGLYRVTGNPVFAAAGVATGSAVVLTQLYVYSGLVRMSLSIDTAQYPWFFLEPGGAGTKSSPRYRRTISALSQLLRRDVSSLGYVVLCAFSQAKICFVLMVAAVGAAALTAMTDFVVKRVRRQRPGTEEGR